jgi:hypothetical protein
VGRAHGGEPLWRAVGSPTLAHCTPRTDCPRSVSRRLSQACSEGNKAATERRPLRRRPTLA